MSASVSWNFGLMLKMHLEKIAIDIWPMIWMLYTCQLTIKHYHRSQSNPILSSYVIEGMS